MKKRNKKSERLLFWAVLSCIALFLHASGLLSLAPLNPIFAAGCAPTPQRSTLPPDIEEMPPVDYLTVRSVEKINGAIITYTVKRGETIELTFVDREGITQDLEPVTFLGLDPPQDALVYLSESGVKKAVPISSVQELVRVIDGHPGKGALIGMGSGVVVGGAVGGLLGGGFGVPIGALCLLGPGAGLGAATGAVQGIDTKCDIGSGQWRIVMPPAPAEPDDSSPSRRDVDSGAGPDAALEAPGDGTVDAAIDGGLDAGGDAAVDQIVDADIHPDGGN